MTTSPESLVAFITAEMAQIKVSQARIEEWKAELQQHYVNGDITDKLSTPYGTATLTTRVTHQYSAAVKQLQEMEILEGIATKKTSSSWTIRPATTDQPDF
jgi:hypothetical protein